MKQITKISTLALAIMLFSQMTMAAITPESKLVEKARIAVENADASDWETLAQSAEICLIKNENITEATQWIAKSVAIKATPYNLELYGDFLKKEGKKREASKFYYDAIVKVKETNPLAQNEKLQQKIWELR
jgi:hypothetical protein